MMATCDPSLFENNTVINQDMGVITVTSANSPAACCVACGKNSKCNTWQFDTTKPKNACKLRADLPKTRTAATGVISCGKDQAPPTPVPPTPGPAPFVPGSPNIIIVLTDDQDLKLGSMEAMPYTREHVVGEAVNLTNFFVNTPICCPSRAT
jgi:hypothetical protein